MAEKSEQWRPPGCLALLGFLVLFYMLGKAIGPGESPPPTSPTIIVSPPPTGDPAAIAQREIDEAKHECGRVVSAERLQSGDSIIARCENGERYRIFGVSGAGQIAVKCSVAAEMGVEGVC
ncbi:MAG: hypothetical protein AB7G24_00915 [Novosphingobium sp.]